jgi:hypothetical protein
MNEQLFINPAPYGQTNFDDTKTLSLISHPQTKLISPYDGIVVYDMTPNCDNMIKIKHFVDDEIVYSVFCGVETQRVSNGDKVRRGDLIGKFGDNQIKYYIIDSNDRKKNIKGYFNRKDEKQTKKEKVTTTTTTIKPRYNDTNLENPNPFMDIMLSPFSIVKSLGKEVKKDVKKLFSKKKDDNDNSLTEEILRIKNLMK